MRISPFTSHHHQQATTSATAKQASPDAKIANIQISDLLPERHRKRRASLIKLTDECLAAINDAIRNDWRIRLTVNGDSVRIHVGNGTASPTIFQCTQQALANSIDAIYRDSTTTNSYQTVSSLNTKLTVNATEKTFAETREKAHKLAEEESRKGAKDVMVKKDPMGKFRFKNTYAAGFKPSSSSTKVSNGLSSGAPITINNQHQKRISPPFPSLSGNRTASPSVSSKPAIPAKPTNVLIQNRHELLKKPLRERCIHLLATGKYKSKSDVLDRLKLEGASKNESMEDFLSAAEKLIKELAEYDSTTDSLVLLPQFHKEINFRWQWLLSSEREHLRRLIGITNPAEESLSVAPTRRNERDRAPSPNPSDRLALPATGRERSGSFKSERPTQTKPVENVVESTSIRPRSGSFTSKPPAELNAGQKSSSTTTTERLVPPAGRERTGSFSRMERPVIVKDKLASTKSATGTSTLTPGLTASGASILTISSKSNGNSNQQKEKSKVVEKPVEKVAEKPSSHKSEPKMENKHVSSRTQTPQPPVSSKSTPKDNHLSNNQHKVKRSPLVSSSTPSSVASSADSNNSRKRPPTLQSPPPTRPSESSPIKQKRPRFETVAEPVKATKSSQSNEKTPIQNGKVEQNQSESTNVRNGKTLKEWMIELEKEFPKVRDAKQAIRYHSLFECDYPQYRKFHDELTRVSQKFNDLKKQFDRAATGSSEKTELLRKIQHAYDRYQADSRFTDTKRQHSLLHARLSFLKDRVAEWEQNIKQQKDSSSHQRLDKTEGYRRERSVSPGGSTTYSNSAASTTSVESFGERARYDVDLF